MAKDIRMDIVDRLETYCGGRGVSFIWALEGKAQGGLVMKFTKTDGGVTSKCFSHRISFSDIEALEGKIDILLKEIKKKIKDL